MLRNLSIVIGITVLIIIAVSIGFAKWQTLALVLVIIAGPVIWQTVRPLPFEFTHQSDSFRLMFLDKEYAREVAALSDGDLDDDVEKSDQAED